MTAFSATLPARWGPRQRLKNTLIYGLLRAVAAVLHCIPRGCIAPLAAVLGTVAWAVAYKERLRARDNVARAFVEKSPQQCAVLVRHMFVHLAQSVLEMAHLPSLLRDTPLSAEHRALLDAVYAEGRGVIAVAGHIGNWELPAQIIAQAGYPVHTIAKPLYDPRLTAWVDAQRSQQGLNVIWRGQNRAARDMLRVFRQRHMLAVLIDQDTRVDSAFVPFFGRLAHTPTAAAALALRFDAPVIVGWSHRGPRGHVLHLERFDIHDIPQQDPDWQQNDGSKDTVTALTARLTARLEQAIRMHPEQWVWMHARWKRQPVES